MKDKTRSDLKIQMVAFLLMIPSNYAFMDDHIWIWTVVFLTVIAINSLALSIDGFRKILSNTIQK